LDVILAGSGLILDVLLAASGLQLRHNICGRLCDVIGRNYGGLRAPFGPHDEYSSSQLLLAKNQFGILKDAIFFEITFNFTYRAYNRA
jgi:hypothetical protein